MGPPSADGAGISVTIDRIHVNSVLIVLCFLAVLLLSSQSAASYPSYLLALSMLMFAGRWNDVFGVRLAVLILLFVAYLCASALWSSPFSISEALSIGVRGLLVCAFVLALAECQLRGLVQRWLGKALGICGGIVVLVAFYVFLSTQPEDGRLNGLGQLDSHVIAALVYAIVLVFLLQVLLLDPSRTWRALAMAGILLCALAVFYSDSRNAWVSALSGAGVFLLAHFVHDRQRFVVSLASGSVLFLLLFAIALIEPELRELMLPRGDSFRLDIWSATLERVGDTSWLFGAGIATPDAVGIGSDVFQHPHNMYLAVLFQGGVVGLAMFCLVISLTLRTLLEFYHLRDAKLALGILGVALPSYLLDGHELVDKVGETWFLFWLPVGLSLGMRWAAPKITP